MLLSAEILMVQVQAAKETVSLASCINEQLHKQNKSKVCSKVASCLTAALESIEDSEHILKSLKGFGDAKFSRQVFELEDLFEENDQNETECDPDVFLGLVLKEDVKREPNVATENNQHIHDDDHIHLGDVDDQLDAVDETVVKFEEESDTEDRQSDPDFRVKPEDMHEEDMDDDDFDVGNDTNIQIKPLPAKGTKYSCNICEKSFSYEKNLEKHMKVHEKRKSNQKTINCTICDNSFNLRKNLEKHMLTVHCEGNMFPCQVCSLTFNTIRKLQVHSAAQHGQDISICDGCGKSFASQDDLNTHIQLHGDMPLRIPRSDNIFSCEECGKSYHLEGALMSHMKVHDKTEVACTVCSEMVPVGVLKKHMKDHAEQQQSWECEVCGKSFSRQYAMKKHVEWVHEKNLKYTCEQCGKSFGTRCYLQQHMLRHDDRKLYICTECGNSFATRADLARHRRSHDKKHACTVCDKSFIDYYYLKIHMRIHNNDRPFSCDVCEKAFTKKHILQEHMNIHTGVKPYVCPVCGKGFTQRSTLRKHRRSHKEVKEEKPSLHLEIM